MTAIFLHNAAVNLSSPSGPEKKLPYGDMPRQPSDVLDVAERKLESISRVDPVALESLFHSQREIDDLQAEMRIQGLRVLNRRVRNVPRGDQRVVDVLTRRHNARLRGRAFVLSLLPLLQGKGYDAIAAIEAFRAEAKRDGFFLFEYPSDMIRHRIDDDYVLPDGSRTPKYIIVEAAGTLPKPKNQEITEKDKILYEPGAWAADCQLALPGLDVQTTPVVPLPKKGDTIDTTRNEGFVDFATENPHRVALVADIVCYEKMAGLGLTSAATAEALRILREEVNPQRRGAEIEMVAAELASLKGVVLPDGTELRLGEQEFQQVPPVANERSFYLFEHLRSDHCSPFETAMVLRDRKYPIHFKDINPAKPYKIIVNWFIQVASLKR